MCRESSLLPIISISISLAQGQLYIQEKELAPIIEKEMGCQDEKLGNHRRSIISIFMHADGTDIGLMSLGFIGAACDGISTAMVLLFIARILNSLGSAPNLGAETMLHNLSKVYLPL